MLNTHLEIDNKLSGKVIEQSENYAKVVLHTSNEMKADEQGLVHGGFAFSAADYAAMVAVNNPFVVLAGADVKFLAPVRHGEVITFEANVTSNDGKKQKVDVVGYVGSKPVFKGKFKTAVLKKHIFDL